MAIPRMISLKALCLGMKLSGLSVNVAIFDAYEQTQDLEIACVFRIDKM